MKYIEKVKKKILIIFCFYLLLLFDEHGNIKSNKEEERIVYFKLFKKVGYKITR